MDREALTLTSVCTARGLDEVFASGDEGQLRTALHSLAEQITKDSGDKVGKDGRTATEFVMDHVLKSLPKYRVLEGSRFSSWAFKVLSLRFRDWLRVQKVWHKKMALVYGQATEGKDGGEGESAEEHLERLCAGEIQKVEGVHKGGGGASPALETFGKRELQRLRATKAVQMRDEGASIAEIAAFLSQVEKKAVKPSSVRVEISRWRRKLDYF